MYIVKQTIEYSDGSTKVITFNSEGQEVVADVTPIEAVQEVPVEGILTPTEDVAVDMPVPVSE